MSETKTEYAAEYYYPGGFMPETATREVPEPTFAAAVAAEPREEGGWFQAGGWYAVKIRTVERKRFVAEDGEEIWQPRVVATKSWIVGEQVHWTDIDDTDRNAALRSNIRVNDPDGYGVRTRIGNWQFACDWDVVVDPRQVELVFGGAGQSTS